MRRSIEKYERDWKSAKEMYGDNVCEICALKEGTERRYIPLWNYGHREVKQRKVCKSCARAHDRGQL